MPRKNSFATSNAFKVAALMPPGQKHKPEPEFDWSKSEVLNWLVDQPGIRNYLFEKCNHSGAIVFDQSSGTWRGRDSSTAENL